MTAQVYADSKPLAVHLQTAYKSFKTSRAWNEWLRMPVNYSDLPSNAQLAITVWDLAPIGPEGARGHHIPFGGTTVPLFDDDGTLKKGRHRCKLWRHRQADFTSQSTTPWQEPARRRPDVPEAPSEKQSQHDKAAAELERLYDMLKKHEMGEIVENKWLDQMIFRHIERMDRTNTRDSHALRAASNQNDATRGTDHEVKDRSASFQLHIEFPRFDHPVLFKDHEYPPPPVFKTPTSVQSSNDVRLKPPPEIHPGPGINTNDSGYGESDGTHLIHIYDPETGFNDNPAETKHRSLVRGQRSGLLDKHLKPNPRVRDSLNAIMQYGPTRDLVVEERDLVWKFRHHLTRDKRALTKVVKSVAWSDASEVRQMVQLLPKWEDIDVDDALELLGPQFDNADLRAYAVSRLKKADDEVCQLLYFLLHTLKVPGITALLVTTRPSTQIRA